MNRYKDIGLLKTEEGKQYKSNPIYPSIAPTIDDFYILSSVGDRYDTLAQQYYSDLSLWWIIATANPTANSDSLVITPGIQIRIPGSPSKIVGLYESLNKKR